MPLAKQRKHAVTSAQRKTFCIALANAGLKVLSVVFVYRKCDISAYKVARHQASNNLHRVVRLCNNFPSENVIQHVVVVIELCA